MLKYEFEGGILNLGNYESKLVRHINLISHFYSIKFDYFNIKIFIFIYFSFKFTLPRNRRYLYSRKRHPSSNLTPATVK